MQLMQIVQKLQYIISSEWFKYGLINIGIVFAPIIIGWISSMLNVQSSLSHRRFIFGYLESLIYNFVCVPIHELSHLIFSVLSGHKITEVKLFAYGNEPGHVTYTYNTKSIYQSAGCYVSAIAPFIVSTALLCVIYYVCSPSPAESLRYIMSNYWSHGRYISGGLYFAGQMEHKLFVGAATLILALSASSSRADRRNAIRHAFIPTVIMFGIFMAAYFFKRDLYDVVLLNIIIIYSVFVAITLILFLINQLLIAFRIF